MSDDLRSTLEDLRRDQQEIVQAVRFLRSEAELAHSVREEAIKLQREATRRARNIGFFAFGGILVCLFLISYLMTKYRILF